MSQTQTLAELLSERNIRSVQERPDASERRPHVETVLRSEILEAEARIVGRLHAHEKNVFALRHSIAELFDSLRAQIVTITNHVSATEARVARTEQALAGAASRMSALEQTIEAAAARMENAELDLRVKADRIALTEQALESARQRTAETLEITAAQLNALAESVQLQAADIESSRIALAHTDDVIERILDVLDYLHGAALQEPETQAAAA